MNAIAWTTARSLDDGAKRRLLMLFGLAVLVLIALTSIEGALFRLARGDPIEWSDLVLGRIIAWGTCAAFVPPLYLLTARMALGRTPWQIALPVFLVASTAASVGKYLVYVPLTRLVGTSSGVGWVDALRAGFLGELMFFWAMIGLAHGVHFYLRCEAAAEAVPTMEGQEPLPLTIRAGSTTEMIDPGEISWIEAEGNYVLFHLFNRRILVRHTLRALQDQLPGEFVRVHRSAIVNSKRIRRTVRLNRGRYDLFLDNSETVTSASTYRDAIERLTR